LRTLGKNQTLAYILEKEDIAVYSAILLAGLSFGAVPIFSALLRDSQVSSIEQSFVRLLIGSIAGIIIVIFHAKNGKSSFQSSLSIPVQKTYVAQGILLALSLNCYLASIVLRTPVGEAALLCQIHPVITLILAWIILKESITSKKIVSLIFAFCGIVFLTQPWKWSSFLSSISGDILAVLSGVAYSIYIIIGKFSVSKRNKISPSLSIGWVLIWGFLMWLPLLLITQLIALPPEITSFDLLTYSTVETIFYGVCLGTIGNIIPFGLIMLTTNRIESSRTSILLLSEPLGAILLGALILNESITVWYIFGGFFLLLAVIVIIPTKS
jgi:drug/metabolite transporter (DMT)-like permease